MLLLEAFAADPSPRLLRRGSSSRVIVCAYIHVSGDTSKNANGRAHGDGGANDICRVGEEIVRRCCYPGSSGSAHLAPTLPARTAGCRSLCWFRVHGQHHHDPGWRSTRPLVSRLGSRRSLLRRLATSALTLRACSLATLKGTRCAVFLRCGPWSQDLAVKIFVLFCCCCCCCCYK